MRDVRVPEECPQAVADLIHQCVSSRWSGGDVGAGSILNPNSTRPTAAKCISILQAVLMSSGSAQNSSSSSLPL
jgi:hypothetical protein